MNYIFKGVLALLGLMLLWFGFVAADSWFIDDKTGTAEVTGRAYNPAWIQPLDSGNGVSTMIYHAESWSVRCRLDGTAGDAGVTTSRHTHDTVQEGQKVQVLYRKGRFSKDVYITEILPNLETPTDTPQ